MEHAKDALENHYYGEYISEKEFAIDFFDEIYVQEVPEHLRSYVDYESFCLDMFANDFYAIKSDSGVHVFGVH